MTVIINIRVGMLRIRTKEIGRETMGSIDKVYLKNRFVGGSSGRAACPVYRNTALKHGQFTIRVSMPKANE
jgi:hypothetical protein